MKQDMQSGHCKQVNDVILATLAKAQPDTIILQANWSNVVLDNLSDTIRAIRKSSSGKIILIGPTPVWQDKLPGLYFLYWRKFHETLPARIHFKLDESISEIDEKAKNVSAALGIDYISAYNVLCNSDGCLTRVGDGDGEIVAYDNNHLTPAGSIFLMGSIVKKIITPGQNISRE